jgi:pimeloyl-ACP methyl ester carboxylesterase
MAQKHLILIHGFLENSSMWQPLLDRVSKREWNIQFVQIPGHGSHPNLPKEWTPEAYMHDLRSQITIGEGEKAFVIGHSMGGYLAAHLVQWMPEKISGLLLFHSKAGADEPEKVAARKKSIEAAKESKDLYVRTMITSLFNPEHREASHQAIEDQIAYAKELSVDTIAASHTVMFSRTSAVEGLKNRSFSLFYFLGKKDPSLPADLMEKELAELPGAVVYWTDVAAHMSHFESPKEAGDFLQRILRTIDA